MPNPPGGHVVAVDLRGKGDDPFASAGPTGLDGSFLRYRLYMAHGVRRWSRFAVLGDIHLRPEVGGYGFGGELEGLLRWVESLRPQVDGVVCVGDLFDLDRSPSPFDFRAELARVRARWAEPLRALEAAFDVLLIGNHDRWLANEGQGLRTLDIQTPMGWWRVEHGDRFDAWIKRSPAFTHVVTWTSGKVDGSPVAPLLKTMRAIEAATTRGPLSGGDVAARAARWLQAEPMYAGMALGHTHVPLAEGGVEGPCLLNAGACMAPPWRAGIVDGVAGEATVVEGTLMGKDSRVIARSPWGGPR